MLKITLLILATTLSVIVKSQIYSRIEADISVKEIDFEGRQSLLVGKVYFDKHIRHIVYEFTFPQISRFAITEQGFLTDENNRQLTEGFTKHMIDFSVFNLFLNGNLDYYGLNNTPYILKKTERQDDMVISEWELPEEMGQNLGKMIVSQKNKQLYGLISMTGDKTIVSKQFFTEYKNFDGLNFPTQLIQFSYKNGAESKKITTFRNIKLNQKNETSYHFNNN